MDNATFDFNVVISEYGQKLAIQFDYDEALIEGLRALKDQHWDETHAGFHNPDNDQYDSPLDDSEVPYQCWHIDHDEDAFSLFETKLDTAIPSEHWPSGTTTDSQAPDSVTITIPEGSSRFQISSLSDRLNSLLDDRFSYEVPDAEYMDAYQNGHWDGKEHVYDANQQAGPIGLLDDVIETLKSEGISVTVDWAAPNKGADINTAWGFDSALRGYQLTAIDRAIDAGNGILSLPTGTGKTITALRYIYELNRRSIIFVHTRELLYQWADTVRDVLDVEPGLIGDDQWSEGPVTIAIMQTLMSRGPEKLDDDYGITIFDECHRTSAAETMHDVGMNIDSYFRLGLSATPWRRIDGEEMKIKGAIGDIVHRVSASTMIKEGYLANPVFDTLDPADYGSPRTPTADMDYHDAYEYCIELDPARITAVAAKANDLARDGHKVLVNVNRIVQGRLIAAVLNSDIDTDAIFKNVDDDKQVQAKHTLEQLNQIGETDAVMLSSNAADGDREAILDEFENGDRDILVSTLLKEGVDIPDISAIVLAHGQKSDIETVQTIGRALRPSESDHAVIADVADSGKYFREAFHKRSKTIQDYYDLPETPTVDATPIAAVGDVTETSYT